MLSEHTHQHFPETAAGGFPRGRGGLGCAGSSGRGGTGGRNQSDGRGAASEPVGSTGPPMTLLHLFTVTLQKTQGNYSDKTLKISKTRAKYTNIHYQKFVTCAFIPLGGSRQTERVQT